MSGFCFNERSFTVTAKEAPVFQAGDELAFLSGWLGRGREGG